jgi:WD40 repeat protein
VRDATTGAVLGRPVALRDKVKDFEFSRDGRWLVTACEDHTARVWDAASGQPVSPWLVHGYEVQQAHFSPDGSRLATLATYGCVRLWNARTGEPLAAPFLSPRKSGHARVAFSSDGARLLSATSRMEAWIRDLTPEPATIEELKQRAQILSCSRLDPAAGIVLLDNLSLSNAWNGLRARSGKPR